MLKKYVPQPYDPAMPILARQAKTIIYYFETGQITIEVFFRQALGELESIIQNFGAAGKSFDHVDRRYTNVLEYIHERFNGFDTTKFDERYRQIVRQNSGKVETELEKEKTRSLRRFAETEGRRKRRYSQKEPVRVILK